MLRESLTRLTFGPKHPERSRVCFNGLWPERPRHCAKDVGKPVLGRRLAFLGPVGQRAAAHGVQQLKRSREVWAAWRALLPHTEGVGGSHEGSADQALCLCETLTACALIGFAPFGSRR